MCLSGWLTCLVGKDNMHKFHSTAHSRRSKAQRGTNQKAWIKYWKYLELITNFCQPSEQIFCFTKSSQKSICISLSHNSEDRLFLCFTYSPKLIWNGNESLHFSVISSSYFFKRRSELQPALPKMWNRYKIQNLNFWIQFEPKHFLCTKKKKRKRKILLEC